MRLSTSYLCHPFNPEFPSLLISYMHAYRLTFAETLHVEIRNVVAHKLLLHNQLFIFLSLFLLDMNYKIKFNFDDYA